MHQRSSSSRILSSFSSLNSYKSDKSVCVSKPTPPFHATPACKAHGHVTPPFDTYHPTPSSSTLYKHLPQHPQITSQSNTSITHPLDLPYLHSSMAEHRPPHHLPPPPQLLPQKSVDEPRSHKVVKAATAVTAGGSLLILSGLTLAGTVIALTVATPLLVIFSPVLVPATITVFLLFTGFLASGGFGVAAVTVLSWIYRYVTGRGPPGAEQLEQARMKFGGKAREMKDKADQFGQQNISTSQ